MTDHTAEQCPMRIHLTATSDPNPVYTHGNCRPPAFNLAEARRLHDRDPNDPAHCTTCSDPASMNPVTWPCPTATALGATGHSEWVDPNDTPEAVTQPEEHPCLRAAEHPAHLWLWNRTPRQCPGVDKHWLNHKDPCTKRSTTPGSTGKCVHHAGHDGPHHFAYRDDYTPCLNTGSLASSICALQDGHDTPHRSVNGVTW